MIIDDLLKQAHMTKYRLAEQAGIPHATLSDICSGKTKLEKCSAETVYKLAKALGVTMELLAEGGIRQTQSVNALMNTDFPNISSTIWTPTRTGLRRSPNSSTVIGESFTEASIWQKSAKALLRRNTPITCERNIYGEGIHDGSELTLQTAARYSAELTTEQTERKLP